MRITKVKVKDPASKTEKMVLINRRVDKGTLILDGEEKASDIKNLLIDGKRDNFELSILNKTVIKEDVFKKQHANEDENRYKKIKRVIEACIKNKLISTRKKIFVYPKISISINKENVAECLTSKFKNDVTFKDESGKIVSFKLADLLIEYKATKKHTSLDPYCKWVKYYHATKITRSTKSIENNKIVVNNNEDSKKLSKRKRVLKTWGKLYKDIPQNGGKNGEDEALKKRIDEIEKKFQLEELIKACQIRFYFEPKLEDENTIDPKMNFLLKKELQKHQKTIFGTNKEVYENIEDLQENHYLENRENDELAIYNLEVVKYFEHFFPIKRKKKDLKDSQFDFYLNYTNAKNIIFHQIENALINDWMQEGKNNIKEFDEKTTSQTLSLLKREDFFALNFVEICAFAASNLRNIIDKSQENDILGKTDLIASLKKNKIDRVLFKQFFGNIDNIKDDNENKLFWAIRGAVQQIRNNITHYKGGIIEKLFEIEGFEYIEKKEDSTETCDHSKKSNKQENPKYSETNLAVLYKNDLDGLKNSIITTFKSNEILKYYQLEDINRIFEPDGLKLSKPVVAFAPGFKKVHALGINIQHSENRLKLHYYLDNKFDPSYKAYYFILKFIYTNYFLPDFLKDEKNLTFKKSVENVLKANKECAERKEAKKTTSYAFNGIPMINSNQKVSEYIANIHSLSVQEQTKKEGKEGESRFNHEKFLKQLFVEGFDRYLTTKNLDFLIATPDEEKVVADEDYDQMAITINYEDLNTEDNKQIAFFTLCKLLDASHLSELRNELIKFRQTATDKFDYGYLIGILDLCLLNVDSSITYETVKEADFIGFFEDHAKLEEWGDLYYQSDKKTVVQHAAISLLTKYGVLDLLKDIVNEHKDYRIKNDEYISWKNLKDQIPGKIKKREDIHAEWVKNKFKLDLTKRNKFKLDLTKRNKYKVLCDEINKYMWLDNKLHFVHLKQLHNLMIEILARLSKFISLRDRDLMKIQSSLFGKEYTLESALNLYEMHSFDNNKQNSKERKKREDTLKGLGFSDEQIEKKDIPNYENLTSKIKEVTKKLDKIYSTFRIKGTNKDRDYIAHYNYIGEKASTSILELINQTRTLMSYDRKLKNAVSKSIINIFDKHGMILTFSFEENDHILQIDKIKSKEIIHFNKGENKEKLKLKTNQVYEEYCKICRTLLEYKKTV